MGPIDSTEWAGNRGELRNFRRLQDRARRAARAGRMMSARRTWGAGLKPAVGSVPMAPRPVDCLVPVSPILERRARGRQSQDVTFVLPRGNYKLPRNQVEGFLRVSRLDACVDLVRNGVYIQDSFVEMRSLEIPFRILAAVLKGNGKIVPTQQIFEEVWGRPHRTAFDTKMVYFHVWQLRRRLEGVLPGTDLLVTRSGGYRLNTQLTFASIVPASRSPRVQGTEQILELVRQKGVLDSRTLKGLSGVSMATVRRTLRRLTLEGKLERVGAGRNTGYKVAGGPV